MQPLEGLLRVPGGRLCIGASTQNSATLSYLPRRKEISRQKQISRETNQQQDRENKTEKKQSQEDQWTVNCNK